MKVSDYMVSFLNSRGIKDIFGIPGVGCSHFLNSIIGSGIKNHVMYHEQGAAFAACGYGQASGRAGFAYTTAGPGGTNLLTGIANAYSDSVPAVYMVGEKDLSSLRGSRQMRQRASQEVDIVAMARPVTKWSHQVSSPDEVRMALEKAFYMAEHGRPGPVLLDVPSDIQRADVDKNLMPGFIQPQTASGTDEFALVIQEALLASKRPVVLIGNGTRYSGMEGELIDSLERLHIPFVTTLVCFDLKPDSPANLGFIGLDGDTAANKAVLNCDLLITCGARLNFKQVGNNRAAFAPNAKIIRIDCDRNEQEYFLRDETSICASLQELIPAWTAKMNICSYDACSWLNICQGEKKSSARGVSPNPTGNLLMKSLCEQIPQDTYITVDTGSHRRWLMSNYAWKPGQRVFQSAGLASMGYALPAAIGVCLASKRKVLCIDGDGGIMMNLQELQVIAREQLPITVVVFNNYCLGDIMEFQKRVFDRRYAATTETSGYQAADFKGLAAAFHLPYRCFSDLNAVSRIELTKCTPQIVEIKVPAGLD